MTHERPGTAADWGGSLSVVIPNYNHAAHLGEAIEAAAAQVPTPSEILVVDDASTDHSLALLDGLQSKFPTLRVIALSENGGAISALNRGLAEARGHYVYFGAADDVTLPGLFGSALDLARRHPAAAFVCAEIKVCDVDTGGVSFRPPARPSQHPRFFSPGDVARRLRTMDHWMLTGAAVIRRDLLFQAGGFDVELGATADGFALRHLALRHGCCFIPRVGAVWQVRAAGLSRSQALQPAAALRALDHKLSRMRADPVFPRWYPSTYARRWRFAVGRLAALADPMAEPVLLQVAATTRIDRAVLRRLTSIGGRLGRLAALFWLTLRFRPISLVSLAVTWAGRRFVSREG